jgi:hypothetical protein
MTRCRLAIVAAAMSLLWVLPDLNAQLSIGPSTADRQGGLPLRSRGAPVPPAVTPSTLLSRLIMLPGVRRLVPSQYATIQGAINASSNGDTVLVSEGTYTENIRYRGKAIVVGSLYVVDNDTSHIRKTVIDGSGSTQADSGSVVSFVNGEDTTSVLCGFTIRGGTGTNYLFYWGTDIMTMRGGGGVFCNLAGGRIVKNVITRNRIIAAIGTGGGVEVVGSLSTAPTVVLEGNWIIDNSIEGSSGIPSYWSGGGGTDITGAHCRVVNNVFERDTVIGNIGAYGGAMSLYGYGPGGPIVSGLIADNAFRSSTVRASLDGAVGGGLIVARTGEVTVAENLFEANSAVSTGNWAQAGGMLADDDANLAAGRKLIRSNRFVNNSIACSRLNDGGGLQLWRTLATVTGNLFQGNSVFGQGGGASSTPGGGAGISAFATSFRMENNIFQKNRSAKDGAGVLISLSPQTGTEQVMVNNTFSGNQADGVGGGARVYSAPYVVMFNNILWNDLATLGGPEIAFDGTLAAVAYSDIQGGWPSGIGIVNSNPMFADTTGKLSAGSPCLGRGRDSLQVGSLWYRAPRMDHFGGARPDPVGSFPDIGACESPLRETTARRVPAQYATIQAAIDAAAHGDTVLVSEGTYKENIRFRGKRITVASLYLLDKDTTHVTKTVIDGSGSTQPDSGSTVSFVNGEDTTSVLSGFTIRGGSGTNMLYFGSNPPSVVRAGGGVFCNLSGAKIVGNIISWNRITAPFPTGGGVEIYGFRTVMPILILEGNRITDNCVETVTSASWAYAGGADFCGATGRVTNNVFERDTAVGAGGAGGGAMSFTFYDAASPLVNAPITGNIFRANVVRASAEGAVGGALLLQGTANMTIADNIFDGNSAVSSGGWGEGGGMCVTDQNQGAYGRKLIDHNQFINNLASCGNTNDGGGLFLYKTFATVSRNMFVGNMVTAGGRGSDNTPGGGGGISAFRSSFSIENNIFRKNKTAVDAGGLVVSYAPQRGTEQVIINNTFTGNVADGVGGAMRVFQASGTVLMNTICWRDSGAKGGNEIAEDGGFAAVANCDIRGGWPSGTAIIDADPMFMDSTYKLSPSSPCIGKGRDSLQVGSAWYRAPKADYFGNPRPMPVNTKTDIGATEQLITDVQQVAASIPATFSLDQNYPNPFNPATVVRYQLPVASDVELKVFDLLGRELVVLVNERKNPGGYEVRWDASGFPSGMYIYRITAGDYKSARKMVLVK